MLTDQKQQEGHWIFQNISKPSEADDTLHLGELVAMLDKKKNACDIPLGKEAHLPISDRIKKCTQAIKEAAKLRNQEYQRARTSAKIALDWFDSDDLTLDGLAKVLSKDRDNNLTTAESNSLYLRDNGSCSSKSELIDDNFTNIRDTSGRLSQCQETLSNALDDAIVYARARGRYYDLISSWMKKFPQLEVQFEEMKAEHEKEKRKSRPHVTYVRPSRGKTVTMNPKQAEAKIKGIESEAKRLKNAYEILLRNAATHHWKKHFPYQPLSHFFFEAKYPGERIKRTAVERKQVLNRVDRILKQHVQDKKRLTIQEEENILRMLANTFGGIKKVPDASLQRIEELWRQVEPEGRFRSPGSLDKWNARWDK